MKTNVLATFAIGAALVFAGCTSEPDLIVDPPAPESSSETATKPDEDSPKEPPADELGLDDESGDALPEGTVEFDPALLEGLPSIGELAALSDETTIDEKTKLPFAQAGDFAIRDGVYYFRMTAPEGMRELIMTVETQANGFVVRRGDRTRLRFVVDGDQATFASEPGSGEIAGRGKVSGDDWVQGAFRVKNDDGTTTEGAFELRKLYDPKTPRATKATPAPVEETAPAGKDTKPATDEAAPTAAAPEG